VPGTRRYQRHLRCHASGSIPLRTRR
jgi:hypothetical protein